MRIVSNIRGLCCWVCLDDVWQLLHESFHFPPQFGSRDVAKPEIQTSCWEKKRKAVEWPFEFEVWMLLTCLWSSKSTRCDVIDVIVPVVTNRQCSNNKDIWKAFCVLANDATYWYYSILVSAKHWGWNDVIITDDRLERSQHLVLSPWELFGKSCKYPILLQQQAFKQLIILEHVMGWVWRMQAMMFCLIIFFMVFCLCLIIWPYREWKETAGETHTVDVHLNQVVTWQKS